MVYVKSHWKKGILYWHFKEGSELLLVISHNELIHWINRRYRDTNYKQIYDNTIREWHCQEFIHIVLGKEVD